MTDNQSKIFSVTDKLPATYLYFLSLYFVAVGVLYLWGYWSCFDVNILEYIGFSDVVRYTAYPIATAFLIYGIGLFVPDLMGIQKVFPHGGGRETKEGKFINLDWVPVTIKNFTKWLLILLGGLIVLYTLTSETQDKWFLIPLWLGLTFAALIMNNEFLVSRIASEHRRYMIATVLIALPIWVFGRGHNLAQHILDSSEYSYLVAPIEGVIDLQDSKDRNQHIKYLGHAGDYIFFLQPKDVLLIIKNDQVKIIKLKHFKRFQ